MLNRQQLLALTMVFRHGAEDASVALARWLGKPSRVAVEQVEQISLAEATHFVGDGDGIACCCAMAMSGQVTGHLLLVFDDASGLALADFLLGQPSGTARTWGEVEQSAALETANIIGCAYLNALARFVHQRADRPHEFVPSPPRFLRDFAESLLEFALMNQAMTSDVVFLTRSEFRVEATPVHWSLLFVPDDDCVSALREWLAV
jgi:chemotaxis protein CheC